MDANEMGRGLKRIAHEIVERNKGVKDLALVGIRTAGVPLAKRLQKIIRNIEDAEVPIGELDITLYRDDLGIRKNQPVLKKTSIPINYLTSHQQNNCRLIMPAARYSSKKL